MYVYSRKFSMSIKSILMFTEKRGGFSFKKYSNDTYIQIHIETSEQWTHRNRDLKKKTSKMLFISTIAQLAFFKKRCLHVVLSILLVKLHIFTLYLFAHKHCSYILPQTHPWKQLLLGKESKREHTAYYELIQRVFQNRKNCIWKCITNLSMAPQRIIQHWGQICPKSTLMSWGESKSSLNNKRTNAVNNTRTKELGSA